MSVCPSQRNSDRVRHVSFQSSEGTYLDNIGPGTSQAGRFFGGIVLLRSVRKEIATQLDYFVCRTLTWAFQLLKSLATGEPWQWHGGANKLAILVSGYSVFKKRVTYFPVSIFDASIETKRISISLTVIVRSKELTFESVRNRVLPCGRNTRLWILSRLGLDSK